MDFEDDASSSFDGPHIKMFTSQSAECWQSQVRKSLCLFVFKEAITVYKNHGNFLIWLENKRRARVQKDPGEGTERLVGRLVQQQTEASVRRFAHRHALLHPAGRVCQGVALDHQELQVSRLAHQQLGAALSSSQTAFQRTLVWSVQVWKEKSHFYLISSPCLFFYRVALLKPEEWFHLKENYENDGQEICVIKRAIPNETEEHMNSNNGNHANSEITFSYLFDFTPEVCQICMEQNELDNFYFENKKVAIRLIEDD